MRFDDGLANRQPQPAATFGAGARFVRAIKALKNVREVFGRNALAGVGDDEQSGVVLSAGCNADLTVRIVVVNRIAEQVDNDLVEMGGVAKGGSRRELALDSDATLV